jgi:hypothetical protein
MVYMKYLRITMPDSSKWDVPEKVIADNRAKYYSEKEGNYEEEFNYTMGSEHELTDWAAGNINWDEVEKFASRVPQKGNTDVDYQEGWVNGEKEIVER